ncbi:hypothetical protein HZH66_005856 [Vespula vulgaris]|uniref:Uncharacterized protein n=1 Tax=Vespula vulgaris TaxID=7454 RepID=A0A834K5T4_VESVU|nr:hypothetical protein HZH66_005856 [Vespula vulgaris]
MLETAGRRSGSEGACGTKVVLCESYYPGVVIKEVSCRRCHYYALARRYTREREGSREYVERKEEEEEEEKEEEKEEDEDERSLTIKMRYCYYHWFRVEKIAVVEVKPPTRDAFSRNLEKPLHAVADGSPMSQLMNLSKPARSSVNSSAILLAERKTFGGGRKTIDTATLADSPTTKTSANFLDEIRRWFTNGSVLK